MIRFIYQSGTLTPIIQSKDAVSFYTSKKPAIIRSVSLSLKGNIEQECSNYLQFVGSIERQLTDILNTYSEGAISSLEAQEQISKLVEDLGDIEMIRHGEALRDIVVERLQIALNSLEVVEDLKMTRMVSTEEEKTIWNEKYEYKEQLYDRLGKLAHSQQVEVKALLEQYDMGYVEDKDGVIRYFYQGYK